MSVRRRELRHGTASGRIDGIKVNQLQSTVINDLTSSPYRSPTIARYPELIEHVIRAIVTSEDSATREYLRSIQSSYTLFAFLNQTPDVQKASRAIFSHGQIWLDTTAILPLFAEQLLETDHSRVYETIFNACCREGDELFITRGVLEEIVHHMDHCMQCLRTMRTWQGSVPFLLSQFIQSGRSAADFRAWTDGFRGDVDPASDIEIYLKEEHGIVVRNLSEAVHAVEPEVRFAVDRMWSESHFNRRANSEPAVSEYLKNNDVEMYLGVMGLRSSSSTPELGARAWLLTKDTTAWAIRKRLREEFPEHDVRSPLLSMSYLVNVVAFSPSRVSLGRSIELRLPTILDVEIDEGESSGLLQIAERVRMEHEGLPERVIRRMVRDSLTEARRRTWLMGFGEPDSVG